MKKILSICLVLALVLGLCACGGAGGGNAGLQVGFGRKSITPTQSGVEIAGGDSSARLSTGFLDEVAATCIALRMGEETFLIYTLDFMVIYDGTKTLLEESIMQATGLPSENILLNATHTHSGVNVNWTDWEGSGNYRSLAAKNAASAAKAAIEDLSPAKVTYGSTQTEGMTFVRHYLMNDGTAYGNGHGSESSGYKEHLYEADQEVQAIRFVREAEDKKDILMMSFPAHATTVNGTHKNSISACYPGATRTHIEEEDGDVLVAFFQGSSGDQVPGSRIDGLAKVDADHKKYGQLLGDYVLGLTYTEATNQTVKLKTWDYTGNSMKEGTDDPKRMAAASAVNAVASQYGNSHANVKAELAKYPGMFYNVYEAKGLINRSTYPATITMTLNTLQLGDQVAISFAPYEMFGEHGRYIKDNSPFEMDFIVTCGEGHQGYLPTVYACEENFYEYDVTKFERGTGEKAAEDFVAKLTEMKNAQ